MMNVILLKNKFEAMGARLKIRAGLMTDVHIDVRRDRSGEFFELESVPGQPVEVIDLRPNLRHLLLMVRKQTTKEKFLCGHDERHWFAAAVPEMRRASNVNSAMDALKPQAVLSELRRRKVKHKLRNLRRNDAFIRQGEWFFLPAAWMARRVDPWMVLRDEPLSRGEGSKPHRCEELYRTGGEVVYVCARYPQGVSEPRYRSILNGNKGAVAWGWESLRANAQAYVRGRIRHADHATIVLPEWHQVLMNTENQSRAMKHVRFLD